MSYLAAWPEFFFGLTGVLLLLQSLGFMPLGNFHFLRHIGHGSGTNRAGFFFHNTRPLASFSAIGPAQKCPVFNDAESGIEYIYCIPPGTFYRVFKGHLGTLQGHSGTLKRHLETLHFNFRGSCKCSDWENILSINSFIFSILNVKYLFRIWWLTNFFVYSFCQWLFIFHIPKPRIYFTHP